MFFLLLFFLQDFVTRAKLGVQHMVQKVGFFGILACASVGTTPNRRHFWDVLLTVLGKLPKPQNFFKWSLSVVQDFSRSCSFMYFLIGLDLFLQSFLVSCFWPYKHVMQRCVLKNDRQGKKKSLRYLHYQKVVFLKTRETSVKDLTVDAFPSADQLLHYTFSARHLWESPCWG